MGKIFIASPGARGRRPDPSAGIDSGGIHDVKGGETDAELVRELTAAGKQERQDSRYYYGRPAPAKPPLAVIKAVLASFKGLKHERGTKEIFRERLERENRVPCPFQCGLDYWNVDDLKRHVASHRQVKAFAEFVRRAAQDSELLEERRDSAKRQIKFVESKIAEAVALRDRLNSEEEKIEKKFGINFEDNYDIVSPHGNLEEISLAIRRGGEELSRARQEAVEQRAKVEKLQSELERKQVGLRSLESRIAKFQRAPDTAAVLNLPEQEHKMLDALESEGYDFNHPLSVLSRKGIIYHGQQAPITD